MGKRGAVPKPTVIEVLQGRPGHRSINQNEPQPEKGRPVCPQWLDKKARAEWKRVVPMLEKIGLLTKIDRIALAMYCDTYSQYLAVRATLKEKGLTYKVEGSEYVRSRPEVIILDNLRATIKAWCHEFGLTPSARCRLQVNIKPEETDPFIDFLNANRKN